MKNSFHFRLRPEHVAAGMIVIGIVGLIAMVLWTH